MSIFGLDKAEGFREFEEKYLKAAEESEKVFYNQERITKSRAFAVDSKVIESLYKNLLKFRFGYGIMKKACRTISGAGQNAGRKEWLYAACRRFYGLPVSI